MTTLKITSPQGGRLPLHKTPVIDSEDLRKYPDLEVCEYVIDNVDILKHLPKLRKAILDLPEEAEDPLPLLPNIFPDVEFNYMVRRGRSNPFYTITNKVVLLHQVKNPAILKYLGEKGIPIESYDGILTHDTIEDLLKFPSFHKLWIESKYLPLLSDELLHRLTTLRVRNRKWDEHCDAFMARIKDMSYPKMKTLRFSIPK